MARIEQLAAFTASSGSVSRFYLTREHQAAIALVSSWMREAGLAVEIDPVGNLIGRREGSVLGAKTLVMGSHIDTSAAAGRFDGSLGIVVAIEVLAELKRLGQDLAYAVEVVAFGGEEASRFSRRQIGALAMIGALEERWSEIADGDGVELGAALRGIGCKPDDVAKAVRQPTDLIGYVEVNSEQGPVLEREGVGIGVVTTIRGVSRFSVEVQGRAVHSGTTPMSQRSDALTCVARMVVTVEEIARATAGLIATVTRINVIEGSDVLVPGRVGFTIDVRSPVDSVRRHGVREIERRLRAIARLRQVTVKLVERCNEKAAACDQRFIQHLTNATEHLGVPSIGLPSGGGHDALTMSRICPVGMLSVRCKGGISHHPDELVKVEDIEIASRVLLEFLGRVAPNGRTLT